MRSRWAAGLIAALVLLGAPHPAAAAIISEAQEIRIGQQAARQIESQFGLAGDQALHARWAAVGRKVAAISARPKLPWTFKVIRDQQVNAVSLPGGFIYATEGLMKFVRSDDELAFVAGHEVGHVAARHHVTMIERSFFLGLIAQLLFGGDATTAQIADIVNMLLTRGFSREHEFQADRLGVQYTHRAGFDASAGLTFMQRLRDQEGRDPGQFEVIFRTHPALADRMVRVREQLKQLGYGERRPMPVRRSARAPRRAAA